MNKNFIKSFWVILLDYILIFVGTIGGMILLQGLYDGNLLVAILGLIIVSLIAELI